MTLQFDCSPSLEASKDKKCRQFQAVLAVTKQKDDEPSGNQFGISPQWLAANVDKAVERDLPKNGRPHSPAQIALFRSAFTDASLISELLGHFGSGTDDFPRVHIEALSQGGRKIVLESESQQLFMLPWFLEEDGERFVVNDRAVGDALYRLLPKGFPNRERIGGIYLRERYSRAVLEHVRAKWDMLGSMNILGPVFQEMSSRFEVGTSQIASISSIDTEGGGWWGSVRFPDPSIPGTIGFFFPMLRNQPPDISAFYSQIDGLVHRVRSIPWLTSYLSDHTGARVELRFVGDRSLSNKAGKGILEDLRRNHKAELADRVAEEISTCAFLEIETIPGRWSRWIVFSNGDMLLWTFQGTDALGFGGGGQNWEHYGWKGVGLLVHSDGTASQN
jgi:hypothetical protein